MKVSVDLERCTGHGRCYAICPSVFDEDEAGHCVLLATEVASEIAATARQAADNCPEQAITLVD